jgi:hypothetical protein
MDEAWAAVRRRPCSSAIFVWIRIIQQVAEAEKRQERLKEIKIDLADCGYQRRYAATFPLNF